jgi:tetratricopeptide (TPR) repeat protein
MAKRSDKIESLIAADNWKGARDLIKAALRTEPDSHWLLSRLALTYYEEFKYKEALALEEQALALAPNCPLALWGYAGSLEMLGRELDALKIYQRVIKRGAESIANGECGEGLARARGLVADCWYRMAGCYATLGNRAKELEAFDVHIDLRGPGCYSIYPLREVHKEVNQVRKQRVRLHRAT